MRHKPMVGWQIVSFLLVFSKAHLTRFIGGEGWFNVGVG